MSRFACVMLLPEPPDDATRADFLSREFDSWYEVPTFMTEIEDKFPAWRTITFCHVEDLPLLLEESE